MLVCTLCRIHVWDVVIKSGEEQSVQVRVPCARSGCLLGKKRSFSKQQSRKVHGEMWAGLLNKQGPRISPEVEIIPGCAAVVARPLCPDNSPVSPGPGRVIWSMLVWSQLEKTVRSGVWLFRGALQGENHFSSLVAAGDWVRKGSYHTAWSVPFCSSYACSNAHGQGPAIRPNTGERCWPLPAGIWRAIAPLMKPRCAEGEVPTAANLNLYRGWSSCVGWHRHDELLFGECGDAKLIVSVSFGSSAVFGWRRQSCPDDEGHLCCLGHGLHRTDPGREQERINVTFRRAKQHVSSCPLLRTGVACCLPTCAQSISVPVMGNLGFGFFFGCLASLWCFCACGECQFCWTPFRVQNLGYFGVLPTGHVRWAEVGGGITFVTSGDNAWQLMKLLVSISVGTYGCEAVFASLSGTAQSPWL